MTFAAAKGRLLIVREVATSDVDRAAFGRVVAFEDVRHWLRTGQLLRELARSSYVVLRVPRVRYHSRPLATALLARALSRGPAIVQDPAGEERRVGARLIARLTATYARDAIALRSSVGKVKADLSRLSGASDRPVRRGTGPPLYLRSDLTFGMPSGGSVSHVAGVVNALAELGATPTFLTTDPIPTVRREIEQIVVEPGKRFWDIPQAPAIAYSRSLVVRAQRHAAEPPAFIYQRYSTYNYAGAWLARKWAVPFVLEYNGSEVWIGRNWGRPLRFEELGMNVEQANLERASLIVVVSDPMRTELLDRGVAEAKILVNPNGVDVDTYHPEVDGRDVRAAHGLDGKVVLGFIGTFGPWHGAEVLAEAFGRLLQRRPELRDTVRLLMIGDGDRLAATTEGIARVGAAGQTVFVGRTRQEDGPRHLAAADILVSPHVPNADGSRFFGSPTKLFEYMAMGRGIVASRLEQIGEVLEHDRTAWLVEPGDVDALAAGLEALIDDPARRARLGAAARQAAVERHTWKAHTQRIIDRIEALGA